jgi:hypothetical protein
VGGVAIAAAAPNLIAQANLFGYLCTVAQLLTLKAGKKRASAMNLRMLSRRLLGFQWCGGAPIRGRRLEDSRLIAFESESFVIHTSASVVMVLATKPRGELDQER